jgi:cleavage and polyadenylation specificity factor subunit 3
VSYSKFNSDHDTVTTQPHNHVHDHSHPHADPESESAFSARIRRLCLFLEAHFGDDQVEVHYPSDETDHMDDGPQSPFMLVQLDEADARIDLTDMVRHRYSLGSIY